MSWNETAGVRWWETPSAAFGFGALAGVLLTQALLVAMALWVLDGAL